eukprot:2165344-Amphidinium_carterae.1
MPNAEDFGPSNKTIRTVNQGCILKDSCSSCIRSRNEVVGIPSSSYWILRHQDTHQVPEHPNLNNFAMLGW